MYNPIFGGRPESCLESDAGMKHAEPLDNTDMPKLVHLSRDSCHQQIETWPGPPPRQVRAGMGIFSDLCSDSITIVVDGILPGRSRRQRCQATGKESRFLMAGCHYWLR
jgi:hypothetical protein